MQRIIAFILAFISCAGVIFNFYTPGKESGFTADYALKERDMEKYRGIHSYVADCGGVPTLFVDGEPFPAAAYMTYFEEFADYPQFADAGYNLFSVPVLFAGRWINANDSCRPFHGGIFDTEGAPDFSSLDNSVSKILEACPCALIFPRVNVSMPVWWTDKYPGETDGTGKRESLYSQKFRDTAAEMLREVIGHINSSDYASHIVGYQLAGGNTEEWFHFDMNAGLGKSAEKPFDEFLKKYYPDSGYSGLPDLSALGEKGPYHRDGHLAAFLDFASKAVADDICYLCSVAKEETGGNVVVGTFYGYSLEVNSPLYGTHALSVLLKNKNVDFICSPNSYIGVRDIDIDWTEMYPADSVRLHGKLCLQECDIRTHLTKLLSECAPGYADKDSYNAPVWQPLESEEMTFAAIRKSFCRQLTKGNGFWWFDMWGGWYDSPGIFSEMKKMREIFASSLNGKSRGSIAEIAVFVDESAYKYMTDCGLRAAAFNQRKELGYLGAPYDLYDVSDFEAVCGRYRAILFLSPLKTENMKRALKVCRDKKLGYLALTELKKEFTASEIRAFCEAKGIHIYCRSGDIIYAGENYIAIHSVTAGKKTITLESERSYRGILGSDEKGRGREIILNMKKNETMLFELSAE